ncbi:tRNA guanosine(34) transglycosylase Tgt [Candidatus Saccharibacteria bacterium]|nr:tRNA guanosine(34) transglycosylase Tgt [Candidatus Saccharibacteria bacterium]
MSDKNGIRAGILNTRAGKVLTPTFMPDGTRGAVKSLTPEQVRSTGVQVVLANTYHLHLQPGEETIAALGGLHSFANQSLPMLTDSGGFQVFSLAHVSKITEDGVTFKDPKTGDVVLLSPEKSIQIQMKLGADMINVFDDLASLDDNQPNRTREAFDRTHRWLSRSINEFKKLTSDMADSERPLLFGIVQGGLDKELRRQSLDIVQASDVDGIAIGGLSVGETRSEMHGMLDFLAPHYDPTRPHFLLGVGDPVDLRHAVERGIDMLDCVLPTRNARHGTAWIHKPCICVDKAGQAVVGGTSRPISGSAPLRSALAVPSVQLAYGPQDKTRTRLECKTCGPQDMKVHLTNERFAEDTGPIDEACDCTTCTSGYSRGILRHQFKVGEPLAGTLTSIHNIRYLQRICEDYRK